MSSATTQILGTSFWKKLYCNWFTLFSQQTNKICIETKERSFVHDLL